MVITPAHFKKIKIFLKSRGVMTIDHKNEKASGTGLICINSESRHVIVTEIHMVCTGGLQA